MSNGEVDRLSVIEHWLAAPPRGGWADAVVTDEASLEDYRLQGWRVSGPYVPAEQLRGAVEEAERLRAEWRKADDGWIAAKAEVERLRSENEWLHRQLVAIR
jgi:hypothetical protein